MRRNNLLACMAAAGAVAAIPGAGAVAAEDSCGRPVHAIGSYYLTYDPDSPDMHWIYEENNSNEGLQAGGEGGATGLSAADDCQTPNPDRMIY